MSWQAGHVDALCGQWGQWSQDLGESWGETALVTDPAGGCAPDVELFAGADGPILMLGAETGVDLLPWNGVEWGAAEAQPALSGFTDPDSGRPVTFACGQATVVRGNTLMVVSCGEGRGRDVYVQSRELSALAGGLESTSVWATPEALLPTEARVLAPTLLADGADRLHAFWTSAPIAPAEAPVDPASTAITYARWEGGNWSRPTVILDSEQAGSTPRVALSGDGRLLAVWNSVAGEILFSWADADRAGVDSEWKRAIPLPTSRQAGFAPDVLLGRGGELYVVYAIPFNEGRGLYLARSNDGGESWSDAERIFDGAEAGWEAVDAPRLAQTDEDSLHLFWSRPAVGGAGAGDRLYYASSGDQGVTWGEPEEVGSANLQNNGAVSWHSLAGIGAQTVHLMWQGWDSGRLNLWHMISNDNGANWSQAARIGALGEQAGAAALAMDPAGRPNLVQILLGSGGLQAILAQWVWDGGGWQQLESERIEGVNVSLGDEAAAAIDGSGRLGVIYGGSGEEGRQLYFAGRSVPLPDSMPTPWPTVTPMAVPTGTPGPTETPEASPTLVFPLAQISASELPFGAGLLQGQDPLVIGLLLALIPTLLIVTFAVLFLRRGVGRR